MTTGDWLGLVCLSGLIGLFAGGFFVWNLFFKPPRPNEDDVDTHEPQVAEPAVQSGEGPERLD